MNRTGREFVLVFSLAFLGAASLAEAQTGGGSKEVVVVNTPSVGIHPAANTVRLPNTEADPLAVKVVGTTARRPFQVGVNVNLSPGEYVDRAHIPIPSGKRLVIEEVSAITFQPAGQGLLLKFITGVSDGFDNDTLFEDHVVVLVNQGPFGSVERSTAHQKTLIFADETVQGSSGPLTGLNIIVDFSRGASTESASVRVTFSGYIEDLPAGAAVR